MFGLYLPTVVCNRVRALFALFMCLRTAVSNTYCLRLVCPMLPDSLDCPFLIAPSVFSNIY